MREPVPGMTGSDGPMRPRVTIVCATYNRGAVLARVLRSVIAQDLKDWTMLVVGDCCSDDTADRIAALQDERIRFVNLPERFGEQSGPNSVGMALADTRYVAFLNHDDYWLPSHLQDGIAQLEAEGADLFWSRAAFFTNRGPRDDRALFVEVSPMDRRLSDMLDCPLYTSEPLSSWIATRDALARLGAMTPGSQATLLPLVDYSVRAWREGLTLATGTAITVLKDRFRSTPPTYAATAPFADDWLRLIETGRSDELLAAVEDDLWLSRALGLDRSFEPLLATRGLARFAQVEALSGIPIGDLSAAARGDARNLLERVSKRRTGQAVDRQPSLDAMVDHARRALQ